jgi:hypothetical protein
MNAHCKEHALSITLVVLALVVQACSGAPLPTSGVEVLHFQASLNIVQAALAGAPGSQLWTNGTGQFIFAQPTSGGWGMVILSMEKSCNVPCLLALAGGRGQVLSAETMSDFMTAVQENGWTRAAPGAVLSSLQAAGQSVLSIGADALTGIMILPVLPALLPTAGPQS